MARDLYSVAPLVDLTEESLSRFISDINTTLNQVQRAVAELRGEEGQPSLGANVILNGHRVTDMGRSRHDNDAVTRGELVRLGIFRRSATDELVAPDTLVAPGGITTPSGPGVSADDLAGLFIQGSGRLLEGSATLDFPNTAAQVSADLTITVTGAAVGNPVMLGLPAAPDANTCYTAWVSAADTVTVRFNNYSAGAVNPASATFAVAILT